jgi:ceramide glucosyltransferase
MQPWRRQSRPVASQPPVSIVVPTSAAETARSSEDRKKTLESLLDIAYPDYEIIVCIDRPSESKEAQQDTELLFGGRGVRALAADQEISANAKIDAMQTGLLHAAHETVLFCDDDVSVHPKHLQHLVYQLSRGAQLVSAAAIGVEPTNLWGHLECSFMNGQFARLHLAGDCIGLSGALGKTVLVHRRELQQAGGLVKAGTDCCEDAAITRLTKKAGGRVVLSALPVLQPVGDQNLMDVLRRHRRWLSCRRKYLPFLFVAEAVFSSAVAIMAGALAAYDLAEAPLSGAIGTAALWCAVDMLFAASHRYLAPATPLAWVFRELIFVPLWLSALVARTVTWYGRRVPA